MAFVKKTWLDRAAQHLSRRILNIVSSTGTTMVADVSRGDENVTEIGTPLNAENMNDLENRIADALVPMTGATSTSNGKEGFVPAPNNTERLKFLRGDGTWQDAGGGGSYVLPTASDTEKGGIKIQRSDGFYVQNEFLKMAGFTGASSLEEGSKGAVPAPYMGQQDYFLRGDGTWALPDGVIAVTFSAFSSLPQNVTDSKITTNMVCVKAVLSNPSAQLDEWTVNTNTAGKVVVSGSISGSTTLTLYLARSK